MGKMKELAYTESRMLRDEAVNANSADFLDKLKAIQYLTDDMVLSINQAAEYYEVSNKTIETVIARNRDEFENDGMVVLTGEKLKKFKESINSPSIAGELIDKRTPALTLLTKRSLLRAGLIMTNCAMASKIRNYLLNLEESATVDQKSWAVQREVGIIERKRMTSAIQKYLPDDPYKKFQYPRYTNMLYRAIFGREAQSLRAERNVKTNDALRDSFSADELAFVEEGETIITALVSLGFSYGQIHNALISKFK